MQPNTFVNIRDESLGPILCRLPDSVILEIFNKLQNPKDLLACSLVSKVFYIFANLNEVWSNICVGMHKGDFEYKISWKITTFFPRKDPPSSIQSQNQLVIKNFRSDFLIQKWYQSNVKLDYFAVDYGHIPRLTSTELTFLRR